MGAIARRGCFRLLVKPRSVQRAQVGDAARARRVRLDAARAEARERLKRTTKHGVVSRVDDNELCVLPRCSGRAKRDETGKTKHWNSNSN
jgi:hypothetical protein